MTKKTHNLIDEINDVAEQINNILNKKQNQRYFEGIVVLYSFIEDVLTWLVFVQILWNKTEKKEVITAREFDKLKNYCNQLNFHPLLNLSLVIGLLDYKLYKKLDDARKERNQVIHQFWLYTHKCNKQVLRKKLEKLARIANSLVAKLNALVKETGMDESYGLFEIKIGRDLIP